MTMLVMREVVKSGMPRRRHRLVRTEPGSIPFVTTTQASGSRVKASRRSLATLEDSVLRKSNSLFPRIWTRFGFT